MSLKAIPTLYMLVNTPRIAAEARDFTRLQKGPNGPWSTRKPSPRAKQQEGEADHLPSPTTKNMNL
jgi:hypothetical protein